ncbi:hypothetical protein [Bacillus thuringiensis]|uniref:hypothetical protein n=1 Tax=Bacillus thuringiensis TaxID=1428 RepID=UPI000BEBBBC4|nr:hypothetical protein [Bacillus thuringiensis]PDY26967.1 hypothetical protein COM84_24975 [Bacillus thuringiensis]
MNVKKPDYFCVYYINFEKVFEIAMLIDNKVAVTEESSGDSKHTFKVSARIQAMLSKIFNASGDSSYEYAKSSGLKRTVEIKSTNSVILKDLIDEIKVTDETISSGQETQEGQLIIINDIPLSILNEDEMRQMKLIKQGLFDRFTHEDISIGELFKSIANDYSYQMIGTKGENNKYLIKIPSDAENEFENKYTIDDLLMGEVTIIGIYKGQKEVKDLKSTFRYLTENGQSEEQNEIRHSSEQNNVALLEPKYHFIDVLAIVQKIKM